MESVNAIYGTFACHASNIAGTGEKCSISIDGPPSALVADTDTTYLIFGGASVILLLFIIVGSIIVCRKLPIWYESKYHGGGSGGHGGRPVASAASTTTGINRIPSEQMSNAETLQKTQSLTKNALQSTASGMSSTQPSLQRRVLFLSL